MVQSTYDLVYDAKYVRIFLYLILMILRVGAANVQTHLGEAYVSTIQ
jgi:hypothetical protein